MADQMRGVFVILCTPFNDSGALDDESLRREVRFCLEAGAHGLVTPANASEFWTLTDEERKRITRIVVEEAGDRIPTVIGVTAGSATAAVMLAKDAEAAGATSVMAMPPYARPAPEPAIYDYFRALSTAVSVPVFIQNHDPPMGTRMSPEFVARLVNDLDQARYIKEETYPPGHAMSRELDLCGDRLLGVMGGIAGRYLLDEYRRGSCGTMPACEAADIHAQVWNALEDGDERSARDTMNRLLPLLNYEAMYGGAVYKEVLRRRGVISSNYLRSAAGNPLDASDHRELDAILDDLKPLFRVSPPA